MKGMESVNVPDGKLVQVTATYDEAIESVTITGDFFLEPPGARADLEAAIEGHPTDVSCETLEDAISEVDAALIGFSAANLAEATLEVVR